MEQATTEGEVQPHRSIVSDAENERHRSISQLKTYTRCGEQYRLERIEEHPETPAAWTALGTAFHESYQAWEESERSLDFGEKFLGLYDTLIDDWRSEFPDLNQWAKPPGMSVVTSINHYRKRALAHDVPEYQLHCEQSAGEVVGIEIPFSIDLGGVRVQGRIDKVEYYPGSDMYVVEDLKTGSPEADDDTRQTEFYGFVANELGYEVKKARYWYTKVNRGGDWVEVNKPKTYWLRMFEQLDWAIEDKLFLPNPGKICGLCTYRKACSFKGDGWRDVN